MEYCDNTPTVIIIRKREEQVLFSLAVHIVLVCRLFICL